MINLEQIHCFEDINLKRYKFRLTFYKHLCHVNLNIKKFDPLLSCKKKK